MKNQKGITLIALIITILVLLILAGISISMVIGNNGIITKSQNAKVLYSEAEDKETIGLEFTECKMEDTDSLEVATTKFKSGLEKNFNEDINLEPLGDGSFEVTLNETGKIYYVYEDGKVIGGQYDSIAINNVEEFKQFRDNVNNGNSYENKYVYLTSDLNLGNEEWEPIGYLEEENASMTNENNKPFSGVFNGNGHEITGLKINSTNKVVGLFGIVKNGQIKNLGIGAGCTVKGSKYESILVGVLYNGTLYNCYNKSDISLSTENSGAIVGQAQQYSVINFCYNTGKITTTSTSNRVGGIAGCLKTTSILKNCYNTGDITGNGKNVGGIVGDLMAIADIAPANYCEVKSCYNAGTINGETNVGGIAGISYGTVLNCYNIGNVIGTASSNSYAGGIVGVNNYLLKNSYNLGTITSADTNFGAIAAKNRLPSEISEYGYINNCYSLENACDNLVKVKDVGTAIENCSFVSSTDLKNYANVLGPEFKNDSENINNGYPILNWQ